MRQYRVNVLTDQGVYRSYHYKTILAAYDALATLKAMTHIKTVWIE